MGYVITLAVALAVAGCGRLWWLLRRNPASWSGTWDAVKRQ